MSSDFGRNDGVLKPQNHNCVHHLKWRGKNHHKNTLALCTGAETEKDRVTEKKKDTESYSESLTAVTRGIRERAYPYVGINMYKPNAPFQPQKPAVQSIKTQLPST